MRGFGLFLACIATVMSPSLASAQQRRRAPPRPTPSRAPPATAPDAAVASATIQAPAAPAAAPVLAAPSPTVAPSQPAAEPEGRYVHFGLTGMLGYGVVGGLGGNIGGRVAFTFGATTPRFYLGGSASYHTGTTYDHGTGFDGTGKIARDYAFAGGEIGFEIVWRMLHFRPYATMGALWTTQLCSGTACRPSDTFDYRTVEIGAGFNPYVTFGHAVFGLDARVIYTNLSISLTAGFVLQ